MRADPALAPTLSRIEALSRSIAQSSPASLPASCAYRPGDEKLIPPPTQALTGPGASGDLPQGIYRLVFTKAELLAHGMTDHDAAMNAGVYTWIIRAGQWSYKQAAADGHTDATTCQGWYAVQDTAVAFTTRTQVVGGTCAPPTWSARWSSQGKQLTWNAVSLTDFAYIFAGNGWQRIR
jgi:hypothetical protein